ncbi:MAG: TfoX/Sxy family protein [Bacteroidales bacterium]|nr:TfoX/Sxy family protein [Bacteroidales bacterium]
MASNPDLVQYIVDQCSGAGDVSARKMFGDYTLYCDGKPFGLVSDNGFYLKPTEGARNLLCEVDMRPPYDGAKPCFYIADVDDADYLAKLVRTSCAELPMPRPKKKKVK